MKLTDTLLRWLPADSRPGVVQRAVVVWGMALVIALFQWLTRPQEHLLERSLIYSYAISTCIWLLCDPMRIGLRRWFGATGPHYWTSTWRTGLHIMLSVVAGYLIGTAVGDAYAGHSTWTLLAASPQRFWRFWLSSLAISLAFVVFFYLRGRADHLQREATEARLKLLETQLEPHMLFNTLATLRVLITTDAPRALTMLDRLGDYLRATLNASRCEVTRQPHTLALEFARLRDYLELMAVRMGPRLRFTLSLPAELAQHPLPPLLLQPLVENAIRHGLEPHVAGGEIHVQASASSTELLLLVSDSGAGCAGEPVAGFGLSQVRERLVSAFGGKHRLQWKSADGQGTRITLRLPLQRGASPTP